ncbi:MAG: Protein transport protein Sec24B [Marteilia pararefringens]
MNQTQQMPNQINSQVYQSQQMPNQSQQMLNQLNPQGINQSQQIPNQINSQPINQSQQMPNQINSQLLHQTQQMPNQINPKVINQSQQMPNQINSQPLHQTQQMPNQINSQVINQGQQMPNQINSQPLHQTQQMPNQINPQLMNQSQQMPNQTNYQPFVNQKGLNCNPSIDNNNIRNMNLNADSLNVNNLNINQKASYFIPSPIQNAAQRMSDLEQMGILNLNEYKQPTFGCFEKSASTLPDDDSLKITKEENLSLIMMNLPRTKAILRNLKLKLALHLNPFYFAGSLPKLQNYNSSRMCRNCSAFINPYCITQNSRWVCSICKYSRNESMDFTCEKYVEYFFSPMDFYYIHSIHITKAFR